MTQSAIAALECTDSVRKRAQWEAFEFRLLGSGDVEVANQSYPNDEVADHTYTVEILEGTPVDCTCPAAEHRDGACKHQLAVAIRRPLLAAIRADQTPSCTNTDEETCPNDEPRCDGPDGESLPCFACYCDREKGREA